MEYLGFVGLGVMIVLLVLGVPVAFAMGTVAIVGLIIVSSLQVALQQAAMLMLHTGMNFVLLCIPLFVFMGKMVHHAEIAEELYGCVERWMGRLHGGLVIAAVVTCALFGAVTGSSSASVVTMTGILRPELKRYKYDDELSAGALTSAGTLAVLIPPSAAMIFFGVLTDTSVGRLFLGGVIPGIVSTVLYAVYCWTRCKINPALGPIGDPHTWIERLVSLKGTWSLIFLFALVIGGIYGGIVTPTEAAAIGVVGVLGICAAKRKLTWGRVKQALIDTGYVAGLIYSIILAGYLMACFIGIAGSSQLLVQIVNDMQLSPGMLLLMIAIMYLILGTMLDMFGLMILTIPFIFPLVQHFNIDPVWFGVFSVIMIEVGLLSPPVGCNVFFMHDAAPDIPMKTIFRGVFPFMLINLVVAYLLYLFPQLVLWIPNMAIN